MLLYLVIMWWQLVQKLFNPVFLSGAVNVRDLVLRQASKVKLDLWRAAQGGCHQYTKGRSERAVFTSPSFRGLPPCS